MDPVLKMWLYQHWLGDHRDEAELAKNHAYLLGSFWNAEAVQQMMGQNVHESSDEDFEESLRIVSDSAQVPIESQAPKKKKIKRKATLKD